MLDPKGRALDDPLFPASLQYVLARIKTRQQKMQLIDTLIDRTKQGHPLQLSSLLTIKAGMAVQAMNQQSAQTCLAEAYNANKYNKTAFVQLVELAPDQIPPEMYFEHLRYVLRENPLDMETALAFAQYAERLELFSLACGDLFLGSQSSSRKSRFGHFFKSRLPASQTFLKRVLLSCYQNISAGKTSPFLE